MNPNDSAYPSPHSRAQGLTKEELGAFMLLQGLFSNFSWEFLTSDKQQELRTLARTNADALLSEIAYANRPSEQR